MGVDLAFGIAVERPLLQHTYLYTPVGACLHAMGHFQLHNRLQASYSLRSPFGPHSVRYFATLRSHIKIEIAFSQP